MSTEQLAVYSVEYIQTVLPVYQLHYFVDQQQC
jgi:hypothetical protein